MLNARHLAMLSLLTMAITITAAPCRGGEAIVVRVEQGREFHGNVHVRSTTEVLWLESAAGATKLLRPIRWRDIRTVNVAGRPALSQQDAHAQMAAWAAQPSAPRVVVPADSTTASYAEQALFWLGFISR